MCSPGIWDFSVHNLALSYFHRIEQNYKNDRKHRHCTTCGPCQVRIGGSWRYPLSHRTSWKCHWFNYRFACVYTKKHTLRVDIAEMCKEKYSYPNTYVQQTGITIQHRQGCVLKLPEDVLHTANWLQSYIFWQLHNLLIIKYFPLDTCAAPIWPFCILMCFAHIPVVLTAREEA